MSITKISKRGHRNVTLGKQPKSRANPIRRLWIEIEDYLAPFVRLDGWEKSLYYHLVRQTRLVGRRRVRLTHRSICRTTGFGTMLVHTRMPRLERKGLIRTCGRGYHGRTYEVLLPREIPGCVRGPSRAEDRFLDLSNCIKNPVLRRAIYEREGGKCFYCRERVRPKDIILEHTTPVADGGDHSYRNVVLSCFPCNSSKSAVTPEAFLRLLRDKGRIRSGDVRSRLRALRDLRAGKLRPVIRAAG
jgi:hypothetical protein